MKDDLLKADFLDNLIDNLVENVKDDDNKTFEDNRGGYLVACRAGEDFKQNTQYTSYRGKD